GNNRDLTEGTRISKPQVKRLINKTSSQPSARPVLIGNNNAIDTAAIEIPEITQQIVRAASVPSTQSSDGYRAPIRSGDVKTYTTPQAKQDIVSQVKSSRIEAPVLDIREDGSAQIVSTGMNTNLREGTRLSKPEVKKLIKDTRKNPSARPVLIGETKAIEKATISVPEIRTQVVRAATAPVRIPEITDYAAADDYGYAQNDTAMPTRFESSARDYATTRATAPIRSGDVKTYSNDIERQTIIKQA
ncbi:MAG: hypothetical protein GY833_04960, partial [Aestuariibacter sp.]|nr:hypothetical protein [Aestuariibacter sp.]